MVRDRRRNPKKRHQNKEKNRALQHAKTRSLNDHYTTTDVLIDRVIKKKKGLCPKPETRWRSVIWM